MKKLSGRKSPNRFRRIARPRIYSQDELALSKVKVNIHIRLDADIVRYFKEEAAREGGKYQSLINQHLRETLWPKQNLEHRVRQIEEHLGLQS
jgi:uncharacterized protein (DUF4415 family)